MGSERWAVAAVLVLVAGCSSGAGSDAGTPTVEPTPAEFAVPEERLAAVEAAGLKFADVEYPEQPAGVAWPTEAWETGDIPAGVDEAEVQGLVDKAFGELSDETGTIDAVLVAQGGRLVVEEYNGWDPEAPHPSWSMAKAITSALVGVLVGEGQLDIWAPVAAPEWSAPGDPRAAITLDQLLRMSSGLAWEEDYADPAGDVLMSLGADADRAHYAASKPLEAEPDTTFEYSTGTANLVARVVADEVGHGDDLVAWIDEVLGVPLGLAAIDHSLDAAGVFNGGSHLDMRPQDFARFGLLYLRGGIWDGRRVLPEGWVDYTRMPTPTLIDDERGRNYGAMWGVYPDGSGTFYVTGFNSQQIVVDPQADLVVVVLSTAPSGREVEIVDGLVDAFEGGP